MTNDKLPWLQNDGLKILLSAVGLFFLIIAICYLIQTTTQQNPQRVDDEPKETIIDAISKGRRIV